MLFKAFGIIRFQVVCQDDSFAISVRCYGSCRYNSSGKSNIAEA